MGPVLAVGNVAGEQNMKAYIHLAGAVWIMGILGSFTGSKDSIFTCKDRNINMQISGFATLHCFNDI